MRPVRRLPLICILFSALLSCTGNNRNLFTLGGAGISDRALGKLAGRTQRIGTPFQNRQFTAPDGSIKAEQAATVNGFVELILWGC